MNRCIQGVILRRQGRLGATVVVGEEVIEHLKEGPIDPYQWVVESAERGSRIKPGSAQKAI